MGSWFRVDALLARHPKVIDLSSDLVRWTYVCVLGEGKVVQRGRWKNMRHLVACVHRPIGHLEELSRVGLLDVLDTGEVAIHGWDEWQSICPADPTTKDRSKRYRERHASRSRHGSVTRDATPSRHGQTETETETEIKQEPTIVDNSGVGASADAPGSLAGAPIPAGQAARLESVFGRVRRKYPDAASRVARLVAVALHRGDHPEAVYQALVQIAKYDARDPCAYASQILRVESPNHHEADAIAEGQALKQAGGGLVQAIEQFRRISQGGQP